MKRFKPKRWNARTRSCQWSQGVLNAGATTTYRHGIVSLFAAYDVATGRVIGKCHNRHREEEFLKFMNLVDRQLPGETQIHIDLDNLASHKTPQVRNWFARRPRYGLHFTPTGSSWINQVDDGS
jgi:DDE superfamily endonuclease